MRWLGVCGEKAVEEIASVGGEGSSWRLALRWWVSLAGLD